MSSEPLLSSIIPFAGSGRWYYSEDRNMSLNKILHNSDIFLNSIFFIVYNNMNNKMLMMGLLSLFLATATTIFPSAFAQTTGTNGGTGGMGGNGGDGGDGGPSASGNNNQNAPPGVSANGGNGGTGTNDGVGGSGGNGGTSATNPTGGPGGNGGNGGNSD